MSDRVKPAASPLTLARVLHFACLHKTVDSKAITKLVPISQRTAQRALRFLWLKGALWFETLDDSPGGKARVYHATEGAILAWRAGRDFGGPPCPM